MIHVPACIKMMLRDQSRPWCRLLCDLEMQNKSCSFEHGLLGNQFSPCILACADGKGQHYSCADGEGQLYSGLPKQIQGWGRKS